RLLRRDGTEITCEATVARIAQEGSTTFSAFAHDISERAAADGEVRARAEDMAVVAQVARDLASVTDAHAARSAICEAALDVAEAIERADLLTRLEAVARTDDLTGLANRRAWDEHLPRELARSKREKRPVCVAMVDLDRFKEYNDEHGHQAGDRLLKEIASIWRDVLRPTDVLARYGGEEFVVLLPNCELQRAVDVIERLRGIVPEGESCSAGVACWDGIEAAELLVNR